MCRFRRRSSRRRSVQRQALVVDTPCPLCASRMSPASRRQSEIESSGSAGVRRASPGRSERSVLPERQAVIRMAGDLEDEVAVAAFVQHLALTRLSHRQPHRTNGRELNPTFCFPSSRLRRTMQLPSACRSFCFETTSSGAIRFRAEPADSMPPLPFLRSPNTRRAFTFCNPHLASAPNRVQRALGK